METFIKKIDWKLICAADRGNLEEVKRLVHQNGANVNANQDLRGNHHATPLHKACFKRHTAIVQFLVQQGANVHAVTQHGETPLHVACRHIVSNTPDTVKCLLEQGGANVNATILFESFSS